MAMCIALTALLVVGALGLIFALVWAIAPPHVPREAADSDQILAEAVQNTSKQRAQAISQAAADTSLAPTQRAQRLLMALCTPEQQAEYRSTRRITVPIRLAGSRYDRAIIGRDISGVNWLVRDYQAKVGCALRKHPQCVYLHDMLVKEDDIIAKLLMLRTDPERLAKVSHISLRPRPFPEWFHPART